MLYPSLLAVHIFCAILWGGGGIIGGFFLLPSAARALRGPASAGFEAAQAQSRYGRVMGIFGLLAVLSGLVMLVFQIKISPAWFRTADGLTVCLGAVAGLGAFVIGTMILRPRADRVLALARTLRDTVASVAPAQAEALNAEQAKLVRSAKIAAWHLVAAALLMSFQGLVAALAR